MLSVAIFSNAAPKKEMKPDFKWAETQMKQKGLPASFVQMLKTSYDKKSFERVLTLNLLTFMRPPAHMKLVTDDAVANSTSFISKNATAFDAVESRYGVPREVISGLLWIETRHGSLTGSFHVPSVYLHLLQAHRPENRAELLKIALERNTEKKYTRKELVAQIKRRSKSRADWAMEQLQALNHIRNRKMKDLAQLKGSFAGAFGMPQFIPSSYKIWAATNRAEAAPNLFDVEDAILSVGNYLHVHGWKTEVADTHVKALMRYNQSRDYAESILEIARRVREGSGLAAPAAARGLASDSEIFEPTSPKKPKQ